MSVSNTNGYYAQPCFINFAVEINDQEMATKTVEASTVIRKAPRSFAQILSQKGCATLQSLRTDKVDLGAIYVERLTLLRDEEPRSDFMPPKVQSDVSLELKEAFTRLASYKHRVEAEKAQKVGDDNQKRQILLAAYDVGCLVLREVDAATMQGRNLTVFDVNVKLHGGSRPGRRGQETLVFAMKLVEVFRAVGDGILLMPDILSERSVKKCTMQELPILIGGLEHFLNGLGQTFTCPYEPLLKFQDAGGYRGTNLYDGSVPLELSDINLAYSELQIDV